MSIFSDTKPWESDPEYLRRLERAKELKNHSVEVKQILMTLQEEGVPFGQRIHILRAIDPMSPGDAKRIVDEHTVPNSLSDSDGF